MPVTGARQSLARRARPVIRLACAVAPLVVAAVPRVAVAQTGPPAQALPPSIPTATIRHTTPISIDADRAQLIQLQEPVKTVFVANPDVADIQIPSPTSFLIYGKKPGSTTVFAISDAGVTTSYTVRVTRPAGEIAAALRAAVPGANINVAGTPNGVSIMGSMDSPRNAERLKAAARQFLGDKETIDFNVSVTAATQVTLRVQVAEVSRTASKEFGVNWAALGNIGSIGGAFPALALNANANPIIGISPLGNPLNLGGNFNALITALDQQGLATILAEPNLTAISGETANFLAGGEYPIPVPQGNQVITIDYKKYGVSVDFTPTVLDGNRISVKVRPEVSELTTVGALTLDGVTVPALRVRRAETTVELGSGQSFAIAGLLQNDGQNQISQLPFLGSIPILGALFRSSSFQRNESELVIIVTPYIVNPVARPTDLHLPNEGLVYSSDIERILLGRLTAAGSPASGSAGASVPHLKGAAGFILE